MTRFQQLGACLLMVGFLLGASAAERPPSDALRLTLQEAIRMAQERNPGYRSTVIAGEVAESDFQTARRQRFPRVDLFSSYLNSPIEDKRLIPRTLLEDLSADDKFDSQIATAGIRARLPVYTGGRIAAEIEAAGHARAKVDLESRQTLDNLVFAVTRTFYTGLVLDRIKSAEEAAVRDLEESRRVVQRLFDAGRAPRLDLLRIETRLANVRQALIRTDTTIETTQARMRRLLSLDNADRRRLGFLGELAYRPAAVGALDELVARALEQRPAYRAVQAEIATQDQQRRIARSQRLPQVTVEGAVLQAYGLDNDRNADDAVVMLEFSMPVFDGGVIRSRINREQARYRQLQEQLEDLRLQVTFEVQESLEAIQEAEARVKNTEAALAAAQEALRVERIKLEAGKGIVNDVLDAQADALRVEVDHATALADHRVALAALARATGGRTIAAGNEQ